MVASFCASRPGKRRSPPGLLGPRPGHPFLQRVPERVLPSPVHPSLPRLWPGRMWRLLSGAAGRAVSRLGPHSEGLQQLQRESRGALATGAESPTSHAKTGTDVLRKKGSFSSWTFPASTTPLRHFIMPLSHCEHARIRLEYQGGSEETLSKQLFITLAY